MGTDVSVCRAQLGGDFECSANDQCASLNCRDAGLFGGNCTYPDGGLSLVGDFCISNDWCQSGNCADAGITSGTCGGPECPDGGMFSIYSGTCAPDGGS